MEQRALHFWAFIYSSVEVLKKNFFTWAVGLNEHHIIPLVTKRTFYRGGHTERTFYSLSFHNKQPTVCSEHLWSVLCVLFILYFFKEAHNRRRPSCSHLSDLQSMGAFLWVYFSQWTQDKVHSSPGLLLTFGRLETETLWGRLQPNK